MLPVVVAAALVLAAAPEEPPPSGGEPAALASDVDGAWTPRRIGVVAAGAATAALGLVVVGGFAALTAYDVAVLHDVDRSTAERSVSFLRLGGSPSGGGVPGDFIGLAIGGGLMAAGAGLLAAGFLVVE